MPDISIIIPALNEEHYLPRLLDSIAKQGFDGELEVIVVDGGSDDKTFEKAQLYRAAIPGLRIFTAERGISRQRNYGAQKATHHNLVFLDADTELSPGALRKLADKFNFSHDFCAIPLLTPYNGKPIDVLFGIIAYFISWQFGLRTLLPAACVS